MADRERRMTPPYGGVFVARTPVHDAAQVQRALTRISHEILVCRALKNDTFAF